MKVQEVTRTRQAQGKTSRHTNTTSSKQVSEHCTRGGSQKKTIIKHRLTSSHQKHLSLMHKDALIQGAAQILFDNPSMNLAVLIISSLIFDIKSPGEYSMPCFFLNVAVSSYIINP